MSRTTSSAHSRFDADCLHLDRPTTSPTIELWSQNVLQILRHYAISCATLDAASYSNPQHHIYLPMASG